MEIKTHWTFLDVILAIIAFFCMMMVQGTVPFVMTPDLLQAVWSMGFSQSFANNQSIFDVFARDIGIPGPAAMAFGLAGAYPASLLMRLGIHAADAYSLAAMFWFAVAFVSAIRISTNFGASKHVALMLGSTWLSMPIIWAHSGYSMVSWGISLLPFYFLSALLLFQIERKAEHFSVWHCVLYPVAALVAVFMDGYTFMMFATGSTLLLGFEVITNRLQKKAYFLKCAAPVHFASFAAAIALYSCYIGKPSFEPSSLDFFRGWGVDLNYIAIPTKGILWMPDLLGYNTPRSNEENFGDSSVWKTTFIIHLIIIGLFAWWNLRKKTSCATGILLVAIFAFYMGLGPSLKINSTKPPSVQCSAPGNMSSSMPDKYAVMPTGSAWISENLPGFNNMRAAYRWIALTVFALWLLMVIWLARRMQYYPIISILVLAAVILLNLPDLKKHCRRNVSFHEMFHQIDEDLVLPLKGAIKLGQSCLFVPTENDFLVNYLAPKAGFRTYNIGGDKNLDEAQKKWPDEVFGIFNELNDSSFISALMLLVSEKADVVIFQNFEKLDSNSPWPTQQKDNNILFKYKSSANQVIDLSCFSFQTDKFFSFLRIKPEYSGKSSLIKLSFTYPISFGSGDNGASLLSRGWHQSEKTHTWSQAEAKLILPNPKGFKSGVCMTGWLKFAVFGASTSRPVDVYFESDDPAWSWKQKITALSQEAQEIAIPLGSSPKVIHIRVPEATSPQKLMGIQDPRIIGIALQEITIKPNEME